MSGDVCKLRLYFRKRGATTETDSTEETLPAGSTIVFAGKNAADLTSDLLFSASSFSEVTGLSSSKCYESTLNLNTIPISEAMSALDKTATKLTALVDIEVQNAGNTSKVTYRVTLDIYRQVYAGETAPSVVVPPAAIIESPSGYRWQLAVTDDGQLQMTRVT